MADDFINYQEKLLGLALGSPEIAQRLQMETTPEMFLSPIFGCAWRGFVGYYETHGTPPTQVILIDVLNGQQGLDTTGWDGVLTKAITSLGIEDHKHLSYYLQELEQAYRASQIKSNVLGAVAKLKVKDIDGAVEALYKEWPAGKNEYLRSEIVSGISEYMEDLEHRQKNPKLYEAIRLGFPTLDNATGGHGKKELITIVGGTGIGKSLSLGQIAFNVARQGKRVLLVTVENDKRSYMGRLYSNISSIPYYKFKHSLLNDREKQAWLESIGSLAEGFTLEVVQFAEGCSSRDILMFMRHNPVKFDYVVADQLNNMRPNNPDNFKMQDYRWYGQIALELKRLADLAYDGEGIPVLTAAQTTGGVVGKATLTTDEVGASKAIIFHSHAALYITRDEDSNFWFGASKYRDAKVEQFAVYPNFPCWQLSENPGVGDHIPNNEKAEDDPKAYGSVPLP